MKRTYILQGIILLMFFLTSCECDNEYPIIVENKNEIVFSTDLQRLKVNSRAAQQLQGIQLATGNQVGVYVEATDSRGVYLLYPNRPFTADGVGGLDSNTEPLYYPLEGEVCIYAYAPFHTDWINFDTQPFAVAADQSNDDAYIFSDLIFGTPVASNPVTNNNEAVVLKMKHQLAKVNVTLRSSANTDLSGAVIMLHGTRLYTTFNMRTGEIGEATGDVSAITMASFPMEIGPDIVPEYSCSSVVVPQNLDSGITLLEIKLKDATVLYYDLPDDLVLESGMQYTYTLTVNNADLSIVSDEVEIDDWEVAGRTDAIIDTPLSDTGI